MRLKSTLKLLLLFCSLNVILNQLEPPLFIINRTKEGLLTIQIEGKLDEYISLIYTPESPEDINPTVIIGNTDNCKDVRYAMSIQNNDEIYLFFKSSQLKDSKQFYVCFEKKVKNSKDEYRIDIKTESVATLPFGKQTSCIVDDQTQEMKFSIKMPEEIPNSLQYATFWVKGRSLNGNTKMDSENYQKEEIDKGFAFHGQFYGSEEEILTVSCSEKNDYITVGSIGLDEEGKTLSNLTMNGSEITVAFEGEICLPLTYTKDFSAITGKIHTLTGRVYFADSYRRSVKIGGALMEKKVRDGIISVLNIVKKGDENYEQGLLCVGGLDDSPVSTMIVSIQMFSNKTIYIAPPVFPGDIRRYYTIKNQIAVFYGISPSLQATELNYNMKSLRGFPQMYYKEAKTFPRDGYNGIQGNPQRLITSNRMVVYSFYTKDNTIFKNLNSIKKNQPLMIVKCEEGDTFDSSIIEDDKICEFEVTFFSNKDTINLVEESSFSQYLVKDEVDHYKIKFPPNIIKGDKIYLDLTLFNGDADLEINNNYKGGICNKYYLSNKVFYSIHYENKNKEEEKHFLEFDVVAKSKVFYMVNYQIIYKDKIGDINTLESGINYITSKSVDDLNNLEKTILLSNFKKEYGHPFMATFYSPNCEFSLKLKTSTWNTKTITKSNNYAFEIITKEDNYYDGDEGKYNFTYTITQDDNSKYNRKFCMLYVAGLELNEKLENIKGNKKEIFDGRSISLLEGVPHIFTYTINYPIVYYSFYISEIKNYLVINFNLLDKGYFDYEIKVNNTNYKPNYFYRTNQIYINSSDIEKSCPENMEVCPVEVRVQMRELTHERKVEITMYQLDSNPLYLEKNKVKNDIINGYFPKHYYFDIGRGERAEVVLDYKRGSGYIFGDIQPLNLPNPMPGADWRGMYKFPFEKKVNDNIFYRTYGKKLVIDSKATEECKDGCYVLITILTNFEIINKEDFGKYPLRISLNPRVMSSNEDTQPPSVKINVNDFIFGDLLITTDLSRRYDYYQVTLPFNSDDVFIDWQADSPVLLVNVGNKKPTLGEADFEYPSLGDFVYKIQRKKNS